MIFTKERILQSFDEECSVDGYPRTQSLIRAGNRLRAWKGRLIDVCSSMLDTDETITVTTAFKQARIPMTANLRATRLGLVAIVDVYIARQRAVESHVVPGRRRHQGQHESSLDYS